MKRIKPDSIFFALLLVLSVILIFAALNQNNQAISSMPLRISFQGEYSINNGEWQEISKNESIFFGKGQIRLRGYFQLEMPEGTVIGRAPKDMHIITYFKHIGGQINMNNQTVYFFDMENQQLGSSACGENWITFDNPADETETLEILLFNPHQYGNSDAADLFLNSFYAYSGSVFDEMMIREGAAGRTVGIVIIVVSFIVLGVAIFSTILKMPYSRFLWILGLLILFSGCFCILDSPNFCLCGNTTVFITTAKCLCVILYPAFMFRLSVSCISEKFKKIGSGISAANAILSAAALIIAITGKVLIYDLTFYVLIIELISALILAVLCAVSFKGSNLWQRVMTSVCLIALISLDVDIFFVVFGNLSNVFVSKIIFVAVFICALFYSLKYIPMNIKSSIHEKELQLELQENKVAVMLSQIQPHFLYNALTAICDLCSSEPEKAREALVDFSVYLRENMDSINSKGPVSFNRELSHIKTYLKLEKLRFEEKINVVYDISAEDFEIQPLTIQPIVENAIKHGICPKKGGGTITIKTEEKDEIVTITVTDDGVGFDVQNPISEDNSRSHIGLENVRKRVENYHSGKLSIESEKGKGTTVTITFRK